MDIDALIRDLEAALALLPPDLVQNVIGTIVQHIPLLTQVWPKLVPLLQPHVMAGIVAHAAGTLDEPELQKQVTLALGRYFAANPPKV